jgi:hypothetical protein
MQQMVLDATVLGRPKKFAKYLDLAKWSRRQAHWWRKQSVNYRYQLYDNRYCLTMFHSHMRSARLGLTLARGMLNG